MHIPMFIRWIISHNRPLDLDHDSDNCIMCMYKELVEEYWINGPNADQLLPNNAQVRIGNAAAMADPVAFGNGVQGEAGEFYAWVTDQMRHHVPAGGFPVADTHKWHWNQEQSALFQIDYSFSETCLTCQDRQQGHTGTSIIEVGFDPAQQDLMAILNEGVFDRVDQTFCANCGGHTNHAMRKRITAAPQVLRIHVNIVGMVDGQVTKFLNGWSIPNQLNLGEQQDNPMLPLEYRLSSAIAHGGSAVGPASPIAEGTPFGVEAVDDLPSYNDEDSEPQPNLDLAQLGNLDFLDYNAIGINLPPLDPSSDDTSSGSPNIWSDDTEVYASDFESPVLNSESAFGSLDVEVGDLEFDFDVDQWLEDFFNEYNDLHSDSNSDEAPGDFGEPILYTRDHIGGGVGRRSLTPIKEDPRGRRHMGDFNGLIPVTEAEYNSALSPDEDDMSKDSQMSEEGDEHEEPDALNRSDSTLSSPPSSDNGETLNADVINRGPRGGHYLLHARGPGGTSHISDGHCNTITALSLRDNPQRPDHGCHRVDGYQVVVLTYARMALWGKWRKMERDLIAPW
jgi:hypothetical protein